MSASHTMKGARLEFVLREFKGVRTLKKHRFDAKKKKIVPTVVKEEGGYLLFTPSGHAYYLTKQEALDRGYLNRRPKILNFDQVNDTETPAGKFKFAVRQEDKEAAMVELEKEIIKLCTSRGGPIVPGERFESMMKDLEMDDGHATADA